MVDGRAVRIGIARAVERLDAGALAEILVSACIAFADYFPDTEGTVDVVGRALQLPVADVLQEFVPKIFGPFKFAQSLWHPTFDDGMTAGSTTVRYDNFLKSKDTFWLQHDVSPDDPEISEEDYPLDFLYE